MLYSAKETDNNHNLGDIIEIKPATGNYARFGDGIYFSSRVEASYARGGGCLYALNATERERFVHAVKIGNAEYHWYVSEHFRYRIIGVTEMTFDEAMNWGWERESVEMHRKTREGRGFKVYIIEAV